MTSRVKIPGIFLWLFFTSVCCSVYYYSEKYIKINSLNDEVLEKVNSKYSLFENLRDDILEISHQLLYANGNEQKVRTAIIDSYTVSTNEFKEYIIPSVNPAISICKDKELLITGYSKSKGLIRKSTATIVMKDINLKLFTSHGANGMKYYFAKYDQPVQNSTISKKDMIFGKTLKIIDNSSSMTYGFDIQLYKHRLDLVTKVIYVRTFGIFIALNFSYIFLIGFIKNWILKDLSKSNKQFGFKVDDLQKEVCEYKQQLVTLKDHIIGYKSYNNELHTHFKVCSAAIDNSITYALDNQNFMQDQTRLFLKQIKLLSQNMNNRKQRSNERSTVGIGQIVKQAVKFLKFEFDRKKVKVVIKNLITNVDTDIEELILRKLIYSLIYIIAKVTFKLENLEIEVKQRKSLLQLAIKTSEKLIEKRILLEQEVLDPLILNYKQLNDLLMFYSGCIEFKDRRNESCINVNLILSRDEVEVIDKCTIYNIADFRYKKSKN